jgi:hypothetical protein
VGTSAVKTIRHNVSDGYKAMRQASAAFPSADGIRYELPKSATSTSPSSDLQVHRSTVVQQLNRRLQRQQQRFKRISITTPSSSITQLIPTASHDLVSSIITSPAAANLTEIDVSVSLDANAARDLLSSTRLHSLCEASLSLHRSRQPPSSSTLTSWDLNTPAANLAAATTSASGSSKAQPGTQHASKPGSNATPQPDRAPTAFSILPQSLTHLSLNGSVATTPPSAPAGETPPAPQQQRYNVGSSKQPLVDLDPCLRTSGGQLRAMALRNLALCSQLPLGCLVGLQALLLDNVDAPPATPAAADDPAAPVPPVAPVPPAAEAAAAQAQQQGMHVQPIHPDADEELLEEGAAAYPCLLLPDICSKLTRLQHLELPGLQLSDQDLTAMARQLTHLRRLRTKGLTIACDCPLAEASTLDLATSYTLGTSTVSSFTAMRRPRPQQPPATLPPAATAAAAAAAGPVASPPGTITMRVAPFTPLYYFIQQHGGLQQLLPQLEVATVQAGPLRHHLLEAAQGHPGLHTVCIRGSCRARGGPPLPLAGLPALRRVWLLDLAPGVAGAASISLSSLVDGVRGCAMVSELVVEVEPAAPMPVPAPAPVPAVEAPRALPLFATRPRRAPAVASRQQQAASAADQLPVAGQAMAYLASGQATKSLQVLAVRGFSPLAEQELGLLLGQLPGLRSVEVPVWAYWEGTDEGRLVQWQERMCGEVFGARGLVVAQVARLAETKEALGETVVGFQFRAERL